MTYICLKTDSNRRVNFRCRLKNFLYYYCLVHYWIFRIRYDFHQSHFFRIRHLLHHSFPWLTYSQIPYQFFHGIHHQTHPQMHFSVLFHPHNIQQSLHIHRLLTYFQKFLKWHFLYFRIH